MIFTPFHLEFQICISRLIVLIVPEKKSFENFVALPSVLCLKTKQKQPIKSQGFVYYSILYTYTLLQLVYKGS